MRPICAYPQREVEGRLAQAPTSEVSIGLSRSEVFHGAYPPAPKAGPRPKRVDQLYDIDMPFVETVEEAKHFKKGPETYEGGIYPYSEPITSPYRERVERGLPAFDTPQGDFPWKQDWFPAKE